MILSITLVIYSSSISSFLSSNYLYMLCEQTSSLRLLLYPSSGHIPTFFSKSNWLISLLIPVDCPSFYCLLASYLFCFSLSFSFMCAFARISKRGFSCMSGQTQLGDSCLLCVLPTSFLRPFIAISFYLKRKEL